MSSNTATQSPGIVCAGGTLAMVATTVTLNQTAGAQGGGVAASDACECTVISTVLDANSISDIVGVVESNGFNLIGETSQANIIDQQPTDITGLGAQLGPLADNGGTTQTHLPADTSPVIDAGTSQIVDLGDPQLGRDQRLFTRVFDVIGIVNADDGTDIGAVEITGDVDDPPGDGDPPGQLKPIAINTLGPLGLSILLLLFAANFWFALRLTTPPVAR